MTIEVNFPLALGGDGGKITNDADPITGLFKGGFKANFAYSLEQYSNMLAFGVNTLEQVQTAAVDLTNFIATSTSSVVLNTGTRAFDIGTGYGFQPGMKARAVLPSDPDAYFMIGAVASYTGGILTLTVTEKAGSGTFATWLLMLDLSTRPAVSEYTTSTTWTKPPGKRLHFVFLIGGGDGGQRGATGAAGTLRSGGLGGYDGQRVSAWFLDAELAASIPVVIGAGGIQTSGTNSSNIAAGDSGSGSVGFGTTLGTYVEGSPNGREGVYLEAFGGQYAAIIAPALGQVALRAGKGGDINASNVQVAATPGSAIFYGDPGNANNVGNPGTSTSVAGTQAGAPFREGSVGGGGAGWPSSTGSNGGAGRAGKRGGGCSCGGAWLNGKTSGAGGAGGNGYALIISF